MTITVAELDGMPEQRASELLIACCGSLRWVNAMVAQRPFKSLEAVLAVADELWQSLEPSDWLEAFAHHPRIGESPAPAQNGRGGAWAEGEQSRVAHAGDDLRQRLASVNREYEQRFGYIYIVSATGKSAEQMLELALQRMENEPDVELRIAAEEQRKITRLRLEKLLSPGDIS